MSIIFQHPWICSIIDENEELYCGGTVISESLVLTAAHCLHPGVDLTNFKIVFGINDIADKEVSTRNIRTFERQDVILHPEYEVSIQIFFFFYSMISEVTLLFSKDILILFQ